MTTDNVELLRRAVEDLWNLGDLDTYMDIYTDDAVLQPDARFPDTGATIKGRDEIHRFFKKIHQPVVFGEMQAVGDKVLASFRWGAKLAADAPDKPDWSLLYTYRDGKAVLAQYFADRDHALRAAGLA